MFDKFFSKKQDRVEASEYSSEISDLAKEIAYNVQDQPVGPNPYLEGLLARFGEMTGQSALSLDELRSRALDMARTVD